MGTDIHWHVEKLTDKGWERAEGMVKDPYHESQKDMCGNCGEFMVQVRNPYNRLDVSSSSTDEEVFAAWQDGRERIQAIYDEGNPAGCRAELEYNRDLAEIDIAYENIKTQTLRLLCPDNGEQHPTERLYHVESMEALCNRGRYSFLDADSEAIHHPELIRDCYYRGRNYDLFGILSDVRGTTGPNGQIANDGLPVDVSNDVAKEFQAWGGDAHTEGWATLEELNSGYDWWQPVKEEVHIWVDGDGHQIKQISDYVRWVSRDDSSWNIGRELANGNYGESVLSYKIVRDGDIYQSLDYLFPKNKDQSLVIPEDPNVTWEREIPLAFADQPEIIRTMSRMMAHVTNGDMSTVRAVWWYDN